MKKRIKKIGKWFKENAYAFGWFSIISAVWIFNVCIWYMTTHPTGYYHVEMYYMDENGERQKTSGVMSEYDVKHLKKREPKKIYIYGDIMDVPVDQVISYSVSQY